MSRIVAKSAIAGGLGLFAYRSQDGKPRKFLTTPSASSCCGIVGYAGSKNVEPILTDGIRILQNRGYDSCGIATLNNGEIFTSKFASRGTTSDCIDILAAEAPKVHENHRIGIAHTRWATHGAKTDLNAHPHSDYLQRISLVHNGTIENYSALRKRLVGLKIPFKSETDTEVIANLIGHYLDNNMNVEGAVTAAVEELEGTWGLAIIHKDHPDQIVLARNGSPLLVGSSDTEVFVASEASALARHTNSFLSLVDGEICVLRPGGIHHLAATRSSQHIEMEEVQLSPDPFPHWTLKEIHEQPQSLSRALNHGARIAPVGNQVKLGGLDASKDAMLEIRKLLIIGCGTSLYAGMYGERLMQFLRCFDVVQAVDASELTSDVLPVEGGGMLLLSQSGETLDTIRASQLGERNGLRRLSIVNVVGSLLARMTNCGVYLNAGREVAVASTKAFTSQVAVMSLVATWFAQHRGVSPDRCQVLMDAIHRLPVAAGMTFACTDACREIASKIKDATTVFILGKGLAYPVALEGALKMKEISYIHAEGFAGGALKHGPFALIESESRTPVILIVPSDENTALMQNAAEQVKARGAFIIGIVDDPLTLEGIADVSLVVPSNGPLTALLCTIPLQILAYELAVAKGINPDKPRGLAKTVTVS